MHITYNNHKLQITTFYALFIDYVNIGGCPKKAWSNLTHRLGLSSIQTSISDVLSLARLILLFATVVKHFTDLKNRGVF